MLFRSGEGAHLDAIAAGLERLEEGPGAFARSASDFAAAFSSRKMCTLSASDSVPGAGDEMTL